MKKKYLYISILIVILVTALMVGCEGALLDGPPEVAVRDVSVKAAGNASTIATDGGTLALSAEVTPADADNKAVTWSVLTILDGKGDTGLAVIDNTGIVTAEADGTVTVVATAKDGSGKFGELELTISNQASAKVVSDDSGLTNALLDTDVTKIILDGTLGSADRNTGYAIYTIDRALTIQGTADAKVYGSFRVEADDVTIKDMAIQNAGDLTVGSSTPSTGHRTGIYIVANNVTLMNNKITNGLGTEEGLSNAIQIRSPDGSTLSSYVISGNEITGHVQSVSEWTSTGLLVIQNHSSITGKPIAASLPDYQDVLNRNTLTGNAFDLAHMDYSKSNGTIYLFSSPLEKITELDDAIAAAKALVESDYTPETWNTLAVKLAAAEDVSANVATADGTYQPVIINATTALQAAIADLEVKV